MLPLAVRPLASADSTEVEREGREADLAEGGLDRQDHRGEHRAAVERMGVAKHDPAVPRARGEAALEREAVG